MQTTNFVKNENECWHPLGLRVREASQCPLAGGLSVIQARALYALINPNYKFDDRLLCNRVGITFRKKNDEPTQPQIKLYPNPTNDYFNIEYSIDKSCDATIQLINVFGQEVITTQLHNEKNVQQISTAQLGAGVYFYKIKCNTIVKLEGKLIVIH